MDHVKLIKLVQKNPVLYDTNLPTDQNLRSSTWEAIAKELQTDVQGCRTSWGKLRASYANSMKRRAKVNQGGYIRPWKYENEMKFLGPFIKVQNRSMMASTEFAEETDDTFIKLEDSEESREAEPVSPSPSFSSYTNRVETFYEDHVEADDYANIHTNENCYVDEPVDTIKPSSESTYKSPTPTVDEKDYFFLSMIKEVEKFPADEQAIVKFKICSLIYETQMKLSKQTRNT